MITRLVESANGQQPFPFGMDALSSDNEYAILRETYDTLKEICRDEGNSIWAWYILNRAGRTC